MKLKLFSLFFFIIFLILSFEVKALELQNADNISLAIDDIETQSILAKKTTTDVINDIEVVSIPKETINTQKNIQIASNTNNITGNDFKISNNVINSATTNLSFFGNGLEEVFAAGPYAPSPYIYPRGIYPRGLIKVIPQVAAPAAATGAAIVPASLITTVALGGAVAAAAMAVGGGGGGEKNTASAGSSTVTEEYRAQYGLSMINASDAYERGYTGADSRIALLDGLVDYEHENFRIDNEETNVPMCYDAIDHRGTNDCEDYIDEIKDESTHLAGIMVGLKDGEEMHGVAYDAMLLSSNIFPTYDRFYDYSEEQYLANLSSAPPDPDDYEVDDQGNLEAQYYTDLSTWRTNVFTPAIQNEEVLCNTNSTWRSSVDYSTYENPQWTTTCSINEDMITDALKHPMTHFFDIGVDQRIGILNPNYCTIRKTINGVERNLVYSSTHITTEDPCALYGSAAASDIVTGWLGTGVDDRPYLDVLSDGIDDKVIFVWPTGNGMGEQPSVDAALPLYAQVVNAGGNTVFDEYWIEDPDNPGSYLIKNWVVVNAVGSDGKATNYSNYCGDAAGFCISAPGGHGNQPDTGIYSSISGNGYDYESGTSMATAHVSGALALLVDMFGHSVETYEIIQRMFETANDEGDYANSEIYGHGLLDLEAATRPVGSLSLSLDSSISGQSISFENTSIETGSAFGDGLLLGFSNSSIMALDGMNFPFYYNMGRFVDINYDTEDLEDQMERFSVIKNSQGIKYGDSSKLEFNYYSKPEGNSLPFSKKESIMSLADFSFTKEGSNGNAFKISYNRSPSEDFGLTSSNDLSEELMLDNTAFSNPYINLNEGGNAISFNVRGDNLSLKSAIFQGNGALYSDKGIVGAISEISLLNLSKGAISLQLGNINEKGSFLGTTGTGAFEISGITPTWFAGINSSFPITNNINLVGSYNTAVTSPKFSSTSIIKEASNIRTDNFTFGLIGRDFTEKHDQFGLYINQPVRVSSGELDANIPISRSTEGVVTSQRKKVNLQPSGKEISFGAFYSLKPNNTSTLSLGLNYALEPNHVKEAPSETTAILSWKKTF